MVLGEWPRLQFPPETPRVLSRLGEAGIRILVAHPERYRGFDPAFSLVAAWREEGAWLQMNHGSLVGRYGSPVRQRALHLLAREAWRLLVRENPLRLSRGEAPLPVPAVVFPEGMVDRIRSLLGSRSQGSRGRG